MEVHKQKAERLKNLKTQVLKYEASDFQELPILGNTYTPMYDRRWQNQALTPWLNLFEYVATVCGNDVRYWISMLPMSQEHIEIFMLNFGVRFDTFKTKVNENDSLQNVLDAMKNLLRAPPKMQTNTQCTLHSQPGIP